MMLQHRANFTIKLSLQGVCCVVLQCFKVPICVCSENTPERGPSKYIYAFDFWLGLIKAFPTVCPAVAENQVSGVHVGKYERSIRQQADMGLFKTPIQLRSTMDVKIVYRSQAQAIRSVFSFAALWGRGLPKGYEKGISSWEEQTLKSKTHPST